MKKLLFYAVIALIVVIFAAVLFIGRDRYVSDQNGDNMLQPTESASTSPTPSKEIEVFLPAADTKEVGDKFVIYGRGRAFENTINYRISNDSGKQLFLGYFMTNAPDAGIFGYFHQEVDLFKILKTVPPNIKLDVFEASAKDGSDIHKTSFDLRVDTNATTLYAYFTNDKLDPDISCNKVFPVARLVPKTQSVLVAAVGELLKGPSADESKLNFATSLNSGVVLNSARIQGGTAFLDFNNRLQEAVGGSCRIAAIGEQIIATAKQFPSVKNVVISINGATEDILQP